MPDSIATLLLQDFGLKAVVATEIEFYLHRSEAIAPPQILELIRTHAADADILLASVEQERGPCQYEVSLKPSGDVLAIATDTDRFRTLMGVMFEPRNIQAHFSAKPLPDAPGSGLHVHVHLEDENGRNVFFREAEEWSPHLLGAVGGLLEFMNPSMPVFAPSEDSYARFVAGSNAPTTVSWGTNNRTVAIRLPAKPMDHKHIEHRVAGADAHIAQAIEAILAGIHHGLTQKCTPPAPVYGDASLTQYALAPLARTLKEAQNYKAKSVAFEAYSRSIERAA